MQKLAIVAPHVIQYQDPLFRMLAQQPDFDLTVLFCSRQGSEEFHDVEMGTTVRWDLELLQGYRHRFFRNFAREGETEFMRLINPGLVAHLLTHRYDAVIFITGWGSLTAIAAMLACRFARIPFFVHGDSSFPPAEDSFRRRVRAAFLRGLFELTTGFMIAGQRNAEYYRHYGADPQRFFPMPYSVENERFMRDSRLSAGERAALRAGHGIDEEMLILYSAKLLPRKDPFTLLRAFERMRSPASLVLAGDGELRPELERFVRDRSLRNVHFLGFVNQTKLPPLYGMADVFAIPSVHEPWGLVVNEAMACGLPIIASDRVGAVADLVRDGENGFVFPAGDAAALATRLDQLAADPALRARMGARSRELVATHDHAHEVEGIRQMLRWVARS